MIETVKKHFPDQYILVRAANRYDAYNLMNAGMHIEELELVIQAGAYNQILKDGNWNAERDAEHTKFILT